MLHEKELAWVYLKSNKLHWWNQNGSCLPHDPPRRTKYVLVLILSPRTVWAVFGWGKRGRRNRHKWSNYLGMRSLFGSISSRLWPRERLSQAAQLVVLSHRCVHPVVQGHFSASSAEGHFVQQLALSSALCWATVQVIGRLLPVIRN